MKKIILLFGLVFSSAFLKAQGNLQFNQIILYDLAPSAVQAITVPAGKVWKIESIASDGTTSPSIALRNSSAQAFAFFSYEGSSYSGTLPFWIKSSFTGSFINYNGSARGAISIIEFNVIP